MLDGLETERMSLGQLNVGSSIASVIASGADAAFGNQSIGQNEIGSAVVGTANLAAGAVTPNKEAFVGFGSPITYGVRLVAGSFAIPTATSIWVIFPDAFKTVPFVSCGVSSAGAATVLTGSFLASGANGAVMHYVAVGSY